MSRPYKDHTDAQLEAILAASGIGAIQKNNVRAEQAIRRGVVVDVDALSEGFDPPKPERVRFMRFCLPLPPNPNADARRQHWSGTYRQNEAYRAVCDALAAFGTLPKPPATPHQRVRLRATLYVWSSMDEVNAMARIKVAEDWLVAAGYMVDDKKVNVEWAGLPEQHVDRECPRLVIRLSHPKKEA